MRVHLGSNLLGAVALVVLSSQTTDTPQRASEEAIWPLSAPAATAHYGDARRGGALVRQECILCHAVSGIGGSQKPDLGRRLIRDFSPSALAASMWNHAPAIWRKAAESNLAVPTLSAQDVNDVYAYFHALLDFEPLGDAGRGKAVFESKGCRRCHALRAAESGKPASAASQWRGAHDLGEWMREMWNHGGDMAIEMERQGIDWPEFTVQEMTDLLVYLSNLPGAPHRERMLELGGASEGEQLITTHGCTQCHTTGREEQNKTDLLKKVRRGRTLTSLAANMWNHRELMVVVDSAEWKPLEGKQMTQIVSYLLEKGFFEPVGRPRRGKRLYRAKHCASCHGAPPAAGGAARYSVYWVASAVWRHAPHVKAVQEERGLIWPTLNDRNVADLVAYLNRR